MNKSVDKHKENSGNTVANTISAHQINRQSDFQLIDNRPEAITQRKLQKIANNHYATIQRQVLVNNKPASVLTGNNAFVNGEKMELNEKGIEWVNDGYARDYKSNEEFKSHLTGAPVDVGLAKKLGRWYRLPFFSAKQFFVLGENHGAFGYRELIKESNQPGKVLGEGGGNSLLSATPASALAMNSDPKALTNKDGSLRESMMENVTAKAYFGLTFIRGYCNRMKKLAVAPAAAAAASPVIVKLPEKEWLENYQKADPGKRKVGKDLDKVPYYENETGEHIYATYGSSAESYNTLNTAFKVVEDLDNAIKTYLLTNPPAHGMLAIQAAITTATTIKNTAPVHYDNLIAQINILYPLLGILATEEARKFNGAVDPAADMVKRDAAVAANPDMSNYSPDQKKSFAQRDYAMYKSVLKARGDHIMAGMGDNHAKNLKNALTLDGVTVVLFSEFLSERYSKDAITPLKEKEGFPEVLAERKGFETLLEVLTNTLNKKYVAAGNLYSSVLEILPKKDWSDRMKELDSAADIIEQYRNMDQTSVGAGNLFIELSSILKKYGLTMPIE